ncbi:uncharacterized protein [Euphorbia lathyris]|uniref:uncharacterized protein isoform X2 n=1 Tax=Euphorbia lathyris TaxID=212925 RepID=UPI003313901B
MIKDKNSKLKAPKGGNFIPPGMLAKRRGSELKTRKSIKETPKTLVANHTNDDTDIIFMLKDHAGDPEIHVNFNEDPKAPLLSFKLQEDNPPLASTVAISSNPIVTNMPECNPSLDPIISISSNPKVTNVKIVGGLKVNRKVTVSGVVVGGNEQASTIQMFITTSKNFGVENDFQSISLSQTEKVFLIPPEAVGQYLVAKYTPIAEDGKFGDSVYIISDKYVKDSTPQGMRKVRGKNMNKKVASLKT